MAGSSAAGQNGAPGGGGEIGSGGDAVFPGVVNPASSDGALVPHEFTARTRT